MVPFRKILFPIDYSAACVAIVPYVKDVLRRFPADLTLVHAYGPNALPYGDLSIEDADLAGEAQHGKRRAFNSSPWKRFRSIMWNASQNWASRERLFTAWFSTRAQIW